MTSTSRSAALEGPLVGDRQLELDLGIARCPRADDDEERERCGDDRELGPAERERTDEPEGGERRVPDEPRAPGARHERSVG